MKSRSVGSLTLADETRTDFGDSQKPYDTLSGKRRHCRHGLSKEEAQCFRRYPAPSAECDDKVAAYWRDIGKARTKLTESACHTLPSGKGPFWSKPEFQSGILATQDDFNTTQSSVPETPCSTKSRKCGLLKGKSGNLAHPLDKEEEHLARILGHLFPSTRAQMARVGSSYRRGPRALSTPKSRESHVSFGLTGVEKSQPGLSRSQSSQIVWSPPAMCITPSKQMCMTVFSNSSATNCDSQSPSGTLSSAAEDPRCMPRSPSHAKLPESPHAQGDGSSPRLERQNSQQLKLLKRDADLPAWKLGDSSLGANAARLVKGAAGAGAAHRDFGGGAVSFVQSEGASKGPAYRAGLKGASTVMYLVQAMQDPSETPKLGDVASPSKCDRTPSKTPKGSLTHEERKAKEKADSKADKEQRFDENTFSLREFRRRILEKFATVMDAFNSVDVDASKKLSMKEWKLVLHGAGLASYQEARILFDLLDANKDGTLTLMEFQVGVESMAPVLSLEGLRKRLLCLGCTSMMQALLMMNGSGEDNTSRPLTFTEFSHALVRVMVSEPVEHQAIWEVVRSDPGRRTAETRVTLAELACALSAVSPCLLLEELRSRLIKRHLSIAAAWKKLAGIGFDNPDQGHHIVFQLEEFTQVATERLSLSARDAAKAFRLIDIDDSGEVSASEFIGAMNVSVPSLLCEDLRQKVRQRYLSIDVAFREAFEHMEGAELNNDADAALEMDEFADILENLELSRKDTARLFALIDGTNNGKLTLFEFFKGIRLFAPACMMEGVRLQILQNSFSMADALNSGVRDRRMCLDRKEFSQVLFKLQVRCDDSDQDHIFDFLDVRDIGIVTLSEIIAALQNMQPGCRKQMNPGKREERAEHFIKSELAPFHRTVVDLKRRVRQGLREATAAEETSHNRLPKIHRRGRSLPAGSPIDMERGDANADEMGCDQRRELGGSWLEVGAGIRSADPRAASALSPQGTFSKLHKRFKELPQTDVVQVDFNMSMYQLKGYLSSAHSTLQEQKPVFGKSWTRIENYRKTEALNKVIQSQLVTDMRKTH